MVISTRSKTGSLPAAAPPSASTPIAKQTSRSKAAKPTSAAAKAAVKAAAKPVVKGGRGAAGTATKLLPDVRVLCDDGSPVDVRSLLTDVTPGLLLFTYPRANTGGCTAQATGLSAFADEAAARGYALAGASYDSPKSQAGWKAKHALKCRLLCDTLDVGLLKALAAHKAPKGVKRSLFVVRRGGEAADGSDPVVVQAHIAISPKDSIAIAKQYVAEHPCNASNGAGKDDDDMEAEGAGAGAADAGASAADQTKGETEKVDGKGTEDGDAAKEDGEKRQNGEEAKDGN